jgi:hypothetical protein
MGFFGNAEDKDAKKEAKLNAVMAKYGLENLSPEYREKVKDINSELVGTGLMEAGMKLSLSAKTEDQLQVQYLKTLVEQNWMIIRLLDEIKNK